MSRDNYRTVVQLRHPRYREIVSGVSVLALLAALGIGYLLGKDSASTATTAPAAPGKGVDPAPQSLQDELTMLRTRNEVDRAALEMVRSELAQQKLQIAELEEGIQFYRGLMAPGEIGQGLSVRPIELVPTGVDRRFAFRLVAQQEARKHSTLQGELYAELIGTENGERKVYPLSSLSDDLDSSVIRLRFKYFQPIEGELLLPAGFQPETVSVIASATKPRDMEAREQFSWNPQEKFTNVGT
jgi:hypothetical protein